ncbi:MAG: OmpA family protein [Spirochaetota bacterium]
MKKSKKSLIILIILVFFIIFNSADFTNGVFIEGGATPLFITGFGGLSIPFSTGSFIINPSLAAPLYQDEGALLFGGFSNFLYVSSYFNFITDYGNLSIFGSYIGNYSTINYVLIKTSFSKIINETFYAGFDLNLFTNNFANFGFGLDFGITSLNNEQIPIGFSFSRFSYAFVLKNLGLPIKILLGEQTSVPPIGLGGGVSFSFLNISNIFYSKFYSDLYLYFYPLGFSLKSGLIINILDYVDIVTAFTVGTKQTSIMESAWFFLGLSFKIPIKDNTIFASYTYVPTSTGGQHSIATSFAFGKIDTESPKAELIIQSSSKRNAFSPNYDGIKDELNIEPKFSDNGIIAGWKIQIINQNNEVVKDFIGEDARKISYLTIQKILSRLFEKRKAVEIPKVIVWDGITKDGIVAPDGIYKVVANVWDERYNQVETEPKYITIDTKIDPFAVKPKTQIFSPNKDGNLDKLEVDINFDNFEEYAICQINILESSGNIVNTYNFDKAKIDKNRLLFLWDGVTNSGKVANEGNYIISVKYFDDAGNSLELKSDKIKLVIDYEILKLILKNDSPYFSSNKISNQNQLDFSLEISSTEGIESLIFYIKDLNGNIIYSKKYSDIIPQTLTWNGFNNENKIVDDGTYLVYVDAKYDSGNNPKSNEIKIIKDSVIPKIELKEEYLAFSPNGDGIQETITFNIDKEDDAKIVDIRIVSSDGQTFTFPVTSIKDGKFIWDGKDSNGNELSQGTYFIEIKAIDPAGNTSKAQSQSITMVRKPEEVSINSDIYYYSPNNDNKNDIINFSIQAENNENVVGFDFVIEDANNNKIYSKHYNKFSSKIQFSEILPESKLYYFIKVYYNNGNSPTSTKKNIVVDLTPPEINLNPINQYFTTNEPFNTSSIVEYDILEKISNASYIIYDKNNKKVFEQQINSENGKIEWNGIIDKKIMQEGEYKINVVAYDLAQNKSEKSTSIYLIQTVPKMNLESKFDVISPNNDNLFDETEVQINIEDLKTLDKIIKKTILVKDSNDKLIASVDIPINSNTFLFTGSGLSDGLYKITAVYSYISGIKNSADINIAVDKTPPKIDLIIKPELFSPDGDGEKDTLFITYSINDFSDIDSYTIRIYRLFEEGKRSVKPFKVFQFSKPYGKTITNQLQWDGVGDEPNSLVDSATDYQLVLTVVDKAGNEINVSQNFTVDILIMKTDIGYKIIINSIEFDFNSAVLKKSNYKILDLLIKKLLKFPDYKILIVGFTDSIGDPDYNLKLSEKRAKAVYDYLIKNDIPKTRLEYKGMGSANPIDTNETEEGRRRNRRVEFYLIKMTQ